MFDFVKKLFGKHAIIKHEEESSYESGACKHEEAEVRRNIGQDSNPSFLVCKQCGNPYGRA